MGLIHGSIRLRLIAGFAAIAVALIAATVYFGSFVDRQRQGLEQLRSAHDGFFDLNRVATSFTAYQAASLAKDGSPEAIQLAWDTFQARLAAYAKISPGTAREVGALGDEFVPRVAAVRAAGRSGDAAAVAGATQQMRSTVIALLGALKRGFDELDQRYKARLAEELAAQRTWEQAFRVAVALAMLGLLAYFAFLTQTVVRPLTATVAGIRALRKGEPVPALPRSGEFGQVSQMLEQLREATQRLRHLAFYDPLTGLASRARFEQALSEALHVSSAQAPVMVVLIELQRLREIASAYGPPVVERCLRAAGERALFAVPATFAPSRYGENRLAYLVTGSTLDAALEQAQRVLEALRAPLAVDGLMLQLQAQAGIARFPDDGGDTPALLAAAETALVSARGRQSGSVAAFDRSISENFRRDLQLLQDLERGLGHDEFVAHYQPIVDCARGEVIAAEALVRWQHPMRGLLAPAEFLPIAERTGQIAAIDARVLDHAIEQLAKWRAQDRNLRVAVNLSPRYLSAATAVRIESALRRHNVPASSLLAELTETAVIAQGDDTDHVIHSLHSLGATICLDDFGTGYSSLSYVRRLPIGQLKIDRSFINEIGRSVAAERIIEATLSLARSIEIEVIAEGVETREQMLWLMQRGCMRQQGWLFGRVLAPDKLEEWMNRAEGHLQQLLQPGPARHAGT